MLSAASSPVPPGTLSVMSPLIVLMLQSRLGARAKLTSTSPLTLSISVQSCRSFTATGPFTLLAFTGPPPPTTSMPPSVTVLTSICVPGGTVTSNW